VTGTVLVTGSTGFIGQGLLAKLGITADTRVRAAVRALPARLSTDAEPVCVPDLSADTNWSGALRDVDAVVHLAARVHVMRDTERDPLAAFRRVNVEGTLALAKRAAELGVRRFIFLSSIKVNGERTDPGKPYTPADPPNPQDPYGVSKLEAELGLARIAAGTSMDIVIVRPPLVYGPAVKGNFRSMMQWLARGIPLPLGSIHNKRSLVARDNLVDLLVTCISHPAAANQTFLAADGEDLSTTELLRRLGAALARPARLIPVPVGLLELGASIVGRPGIALRLCDSLQVDSGAARLRLGWSPPVSVNDGLSQAAQYFLSNPAVT
jgi:nucleoside-diphosphate-sugar epimerase